MMGSRRELRKKRIGMNEAEKQGKTKPDCAVMASRGGKNGVLFEEGASQETLSRGARGRRGGGRHAVQVKSRAIGRENAVVEGSHPGEPQRGGNSFFDGGNPIAARSASKSKGEITNSAGTRIHAQRHHS